MGLSAAPAAATETADITSTGTMDKKRRIPEHAML
jgi:hypothetical protein